MTIINPFNSKDPTSSGGVPTPRIPDWVPPVDTGQPSTPDLNDLSNVRRKTIAAANTVIPITWGRDRIFGQLFIVEVDETNGFMYAGYTFGRGEIDAFETIYVDGVNINGGFLTFAGSAKEEHLGTQGQATSTLLSGAIAGYSDTLSGIAYVVLKIPPDSTGGFPRVEAIIRGQLVYDPRLDSTFPGGSGAHRVDDDTTWEYSNNPTLCFGNFAEVHTDWDVDYQGIFDGANANDEQVGGENRREVGLTMNRSATADSWAKAWRMYMGAFLAWEDGKVRVIPATSTVEVQGAMSLDGALQSWADAGDIAVLDFGPTDDFTVEVMFKLSEDAVNSVVVAKKNTLETATDAGYNLYVDAGGNIVVQICDATTIVNDTTSGTDYKDDNWHRASFSVNRTSDELILYVDGVARTPLDISSVTGSLVNSVDFRVGATSGGAFRMVGLVDDVRVWNDIRTPTEISDNVLIEIDNPASEANLVGYWRLNDGVGQTAVDSSSEGNDLALTANAGFALGAQSLIPENVTRHFTTDDIVKDSVRLRKRGSRQMPTVVQVEYTDQTNDTWRTERQQAKDPGVDTGDVPARFSRVSLPGIHRPTQAKREAIERLNWFISDLEITFSCFDEGLELQTGSIIAVTHDIGLEGKLFRVRRISGASGRWTIDGSEYDPAVYSDEVISEPSTPDTNLGNPLSPPTVTGLSASEELFIYKNGITGSRVRATWSDSYPFATSYLVEGFVDGTKVWQSVVYDNEAVSPGVEELVITDPVEYDVHVSIITPFTTGPVEIETVTILGKLAVPGDVPSISANLINANTASVSWGAATDIDIWRYELRIGTIFDTFETATVVDLVDGLNYVATDLPLGFSRLFVKAVDTVGNRSNNAVLKDVNTVLPSQPTGFSGFEIASEVRLSWTANLATEFVDRYRISYSDQPETFETDLDTVDGLRFSTKDVPEGTFTFKLYAINAQGASTAATLSVQVSSDAGSFQASSHDFQVETTAGGAGVDPWDGTWDTSWNSYWLTAGGGGPPVVTGLTNMHSYQFRDNPSTGKIYYVTSPDTADTFDTSAAPHDFDTETAALANYHVAVNSEWLSEEHDFGTTLTGNWLLTDDVTALDGTFIRTIELSTDAVSWNVFPGTSARGSYRYARIRYTATGNDTVFVVAPPVTLRVMVVAVSETGSSTSQASGPERIELTKEYSAVKKVNAQPVTPVTIASRASIIDNIIVGKNTGIQGDGTNYLDGGDIATFDFGSGQDFTVECWVKHSGGTGTDDVIVGKRNGASAGWEMYFDENADQVRFAIHDGTASADTNINGVTNDGLFHHVAFTVDRTNDEIIRYLDGVQFSTAVDISSVTASLDAGTAAFRCFADSAAGNIWSGAMDELRIWSDERTVTEIANNMSLEIDINSANLIGYWRMNGTEGASVVDAEDQITTPTAGDDLTSTGAGALTYVSTSEDTGISKINYFDVYIFDDGTTQVANDFIWDWEGV